MRLVLFTACSLFASCIVSIAADTNSVTTVGGRPAFPGLALDEMGFPTNKAVAYAQGQAEARRDLTNGVLIVKTYGFPGPSSSEYDRLLEKCCGVKDQGIAGCMVSEGLTSYAAGYNDVSCAYIKQTFGTNIFDKLAAEAQGNWQGGNSGGVYKVQSGDTLAKIAHRQGVTLKALEKANPDLDPDKIKVGQKILIPGAAK